MGRVYTSRVIAEIHIQCEACNHAFGYTKEFSASSSSAEAAASGAMLQANQACAPEEVQVLACPKCHYVQSWMQKASLRTTGCLLFTFSLIFSLFAAAACVAVLPFPSNAWGGAACIAAPLFAGSATLYLLTKYAIPKYLVPNRVYHRQHGPDVPPPRQATVTLR